MKVHIICLTLLLTFDLIIYWILHYNDTDHQFIFPKSTFIYFFLLLFIDFIAFVCVYTHSRTSTAMVSSKTNDDNKNLTFLSL